MYIQAKKVETKTLDGAMKRTDAAGDVKSASMKCINLDREVGKI